MRHLVLPLVSLALALGAPPRAAAQAVPGTLIMALPADPRPVPYLIRNTSDADVADQLFLRLAGLGATLRTTGDDAMQPELAERWVRRDSLTLEFTLDARARWHDGTPVTSRDVTFAWQLIHQPALGVDLAPFAMIAAVEAIDDRRFAVRFRRPSVEQVYHVAFQLQPMPAHLLARIPAESLATSAFTAAPVGNGPYRFERRVPGQVTELRAVDPHFRGRPGIARVLFRAIADGTARFNALLSGEIDVMGDLSPTQAQQARQRPTLRIVAEPHNLVTYLLYNARVPGDTARAHPILADRRVREALALALDRRVVATGAFGSSTLAPDAVRSQAWNWLGGVPAPARANLRAARALLAEAGWRDTDGDGVLDRNGAPLELRIIYPGPSASRSVIAVQVERMLDAAGVRAVLEPLEGPVWFAKRRAGDFDIDISAVNQDASPYSLVQAWSCTAASQPITSNVGRWCDAEFDRLLAGAATQRDPNAGYRAALERMADWRPAVVVAAPINIVAVHTRLEQVRIRPIKAFTDLWRWRVRPGAALARDR